MSDFNPFAKEFEKARRAVESPPPSEPPDKERVKNYELVAKMMKAQLAEPDTASEQIVEKVLAKEKERTSRQENISIHSEPVQTDFFDTLDRDKARNKKRAA